MIVGSGFDLGPRGSVLHEARWKGFSKTSPSPLRSCSGQASGTRVVTVRSALARVRLQSALGDFRLRPFGTHGPGQRMYVACRSASPSAALLAVPLGSDGLHPPGSECRNRVWT